MFFKYITEDLWNDEIQKYKNSCSINNSYFEKSLINIYNSYDDNESLYIIEDEIKWIIDKLNNSKYHNNAIDNIEYDIDNICKLGFIDITLSFDIEVETFKSFLNYINTTF